MQRFRFSIIFYLLRFRAVTRAWAAATFSFVIWSSIILSCSFMIWISQTILRPWAAAIWSAIANGAQPDSAFWSPLAPSRNRWVINSKSFGCRTKLNDEFFNVYEGFSYVYESWIEIYLSFDACFHPALRLFFSIHGVSRHFTRILFLCH